MDDVRYSRENKDWAREIFIPPDDRNVDFIVQGHCGLLDLFLDEARQRYKELGLFNCSHCEDGPLDYKQRVLVLEPEMLGQQYKTPDNQLFYAFGGFGCAFGANGKKILGQFLNNGEKTSFRRDDFVGVLKDEFLPEWAAENLEQLQSPNEQEDSPIPTM